MVPRLIDKARDLRKRETDVEAKLWSRLRNRRLADLKFRRQVPRGPFIADFLCDEAMLIVEVDGSQHGEADQLLRDRERTAYLKSLGYEIIRVWNAEVNSNLFGVIATIHTTAIARLKAPSSALRAPSPQGEKASRRKTSPS